MSASSYSTSPAAFPRKILLVASGMSPQVLTETLYALLHEEPPFVPDEVHMVTTSIGKNGAISQLLAEGDGYFYRFCRDYNFSESAFKQDFIHVIRDNEDNELTDIVTREDNENAADYITELIRKYTEDDNSSLHVSLAGGRKTMSYFTGYALSLYGRPQDRLSHVLIDPGYEGLRDFYYPTPVSSIIIDRNGQELDASKAQVSLADIPFIRLREDLPGQLIKGKQSFRETVEAMRLIEKPLSLSFDTPNKTVYCSGIAIEMPPAEYAFYDFIVNERQAVDGELTCMPYEIIGIDGKDTGKDAHFAELFIKCLERCNVFVKDATYKTLTDGMSESYFKDRVARVKKILTTALGKRVAEPYIITVRGGRGSRLYGIDPAVFEDNE